MESQAIVDRWGAKLSGQQVLFPDPDLVLRRTLFTETGDKSFDQEALIHWWMHVYNYDKDYLPDNKVPYEVYKTYSNALLKFFNYAKASGCYSPKTNQSVIDLACYKHKPVEDHMAELNMWLPHIIEINGCKYVKIFERSLSEYGVYTMRVYKDRTDLEFCRHGHVEVIETRPTVEKMVAHVHDRHYYQDGEDNE